MERMVNVKGYEGLYKVSEAGVVYSVDRIVKRTETTSKLVKGKPLKPQRCTSGYLTVSLSKNGVVKQMLIHRIVAISFYGIKSGMEVNHINENKEDTSLCNLEWVSHKENINHGSAIERRVENSDFKGKNNPMYGRHGDKNTMSKRVRQYTLGDVFVAEYASVREAARETGFNCSSIVGAANGRYKQAYGFIWKYNS